MARYRGPKNRIARKFGANIFGRRKNPLATKSNPPGMHGAKEKNAPTSAISYMKNKSSQAFTVLSP